jgi:hypothetical protein
MGYSALVTSAKSSGVAGLIGFAAAVAYLCATAGSRVAAAQTLSPQSLAAPSAPVVSGADILGSLTKPIGPAGISIADFMKKSLSEAKQGAADIPLSTAALVRALRDDAPAVESELKVLDDHFELVKAAAQQGDPTAGNALLAALALDRASGEKLTARLDSVDVVAARQVRSDLGEARRLLTSFIGNQTIASLLAQGSVRGALSGNTETNTAGTGSIGLALSRGKWALSGLITVASSIDTLRSGFGSFLLTPASGKGSLSTCLIDLHTPSIAGLWKGAPGARFWPGLHTYFTGANSTWQARTISPDATDTTFAFKQAAVLGIGALLNWRVSRGRLLNTPVQINVETGYSRRYLRGDVFADTAFVRTALDFPASSPLKKSWGAWESGFQMSIGAVTAGVQYYWIDGNNDRTFVSGLTNGQLIIAIAVAGNVVSGVLGQ